MSETIEKKTKSKNPKCPRCGFQLRIHDHYGSKKFIRYICPNKKCSVKTITRNSLLKKNFYPHKLDLIYNVLVRIIDDKKLLLDTIKSKGTIPQFIVDKCIRELLRHTKYAILDNAFMAIPITVSELKKVCENYDLSLPFVVLFPTTNKEIYTCIIDKNKRSVLKEDNHHLQNYRDLLAGVKETSD